MRNRTLRWAIPIYTVVWLSACSLTHENRHFTSDELLGGISGNMIDGSAARIPDSDGTVMSSVPEAPLPDNRKISIEDAVLLALRNNRALRIEQINPMIKDTFVEQEKSEFDPALAGAISTVDRTDFEDRVETSSGSEMAELSVTETFASGTSVNLEMNVTRENEPRLVSSDTTLTVTQALLQDFGPAINRAKIRQARIDSAISEFELRGFTEALVAEVEDTYWELVLARHQVKIVEESMNLVKQEMEETQQRIRVGTLAETEITAVEAEYALQLESLINARSEADILQIKFLRLICPEVLHSPDRMVNLSSELLVPMSASEHLENHIAVAFQMRPDLNEALMRIQRGEIDLVRTKNGLLPQMDLFINLGRTGYAETFRDSLKTKKNRTDTVEVGLSFDTSIFKRSDRADHHRAGLTQQQIETSYQNMKDLIRQDVESAYIEVKRTRQQIDATAGTHRLQKEKLRVESVKFHAGESTAFFVAQAHRDLLVSEVAEIRALINYHKALTHLYFTEGSLLERRGFDVPGRNPPIPY